MSKMKVCIVSMAAEFAAVLAQMLELDEIEANVVESWEQACVDISDNGVQLVVLDCPGSGVESLGLCREIRSQYRGLLLLTTNELDLQLHVLALEVGADVALAVGSGLPLIAAQIKVLLRRFCPTTPQPIQTFGHLTVNSLKRDVYVSEQAALLSTIEFDLLWALVKHAGAVVSREEIHQDIYHSPYNGYDRGIDIYISRIRQKIGDDPTVPRYLKTVRGAGYQFVAACD